MHNAQTADSPRIYVQACRALTALGDEHQSAAALAAGRSALRLEAVLANQATQDAGQQETVTLPDAGSEASLVPLALISPMSTALPPRWWQPLLELAAPLREQGWGSPRRPVFITGSNYGVDSLYAVSLQHAAQSQGNTAESAGISEHTAWGTAHGIVRQLRDALNWGRNVTIISHACVSAQLGLMQAQRALQLGLADEVLVFSFDFLSPFVTGGFHALKILNSGLPQPYRSSETGSISLGDGAAWAVLSSKPSACRILAQSTFNEMHHFTANAADGSGFRAALAPLLATARQHRLWIKGHGTGTLEAGRLETEATLEALPEAPLVSWKGGIGHTLGSCALVELAITLAATQAATIPGSVSPHPAPSAPMAHNIATSAFDAKEFDATLLLCNAFGGAHAGMIISHE